MPGKETDLIHYEDAWGTGPGKYKPGSYPSCSTTLDEHGDAILVDPVGPETAALLAENRNMLHAAVPTVQMPIHNDMAWGGTHGKWGGTSLN